MWILTKNPAELQEEIEEKILQLQVELILSTQSVDKK